VTAIAIRIRRALFGLAPGEALFERRGFAPAAAASQARLEDVGRTFIAGYNAWLAHDLDGELSRLPAERHGFAIEGAAMASALVDPLAPWRRGRWAQLLAERPGHLYMIHVGAGWAVARLGGSLRRAIARRDSLLGWLVADGWGFHQAYFHPTRWASGQRQVPASWGYAARAVDQGIGRALWFIAGADPARVAGHIAWFGSERHPDLWSGVGLAATYAGGCAPEDLAALPGIAGRSRGQLAQGAAFAATARHVAGNPAAHTEAAAAALTGRSAAELARLAQELQPAPPHDPAGSHYEAWRARLAEALATRRAA
jgi:enediyne biosynthesis protein E3